MMHKEPHSATPHQIEDAARIAVQRQRMENRDLASIVREVVALQFCSVAVSSIEHGDAYSTESLIAAVTERAVVLRDDCSCFDRVDEASIESFPASDPPAWIGHRFPSK